ncbi:DUF3263 domain-containing protein [Planosporangium flavigriseum]|uniref:DUF3263 domain-containing protein n=1 Tax=Planosporangium flavigriseum TaxID=373681 RepID=A0A8J3LU75_9ACTN|nr:DUF3263 domain-containing protein [Planosporangium flavigriseum]NJC63801.1 DUF3263 domain-containing protein [Planosporangium flavigriseum]GIG73701.1 hypothetical protein Pfl04_21050 [Planosporangium flavigriseum]
MERAENEARKVIEAEDEPADPAPDSVDQPQSISDVGAAELTDGERALLDFEKQWWRQPGAKEQAIRDRFDLSPTSYYRLLNALLDRPAALAYDPVLVNRLQRVRTGRGPTRR